MSTALAEPYADLAAAMRAAPAILPVGAGTQLGVGGAVRPDAVVVRAPAGVVDVQPADMTVTAHGGTTVAELAAVLAPHGQECPLDPVDGGATVGGVLATGLSGWRRLGVGPLRDTVLEVTLVLADGRVVRGGGPTVKNVTGYDVPRLVVGSLGTLGVIGRVILRTRPVPRASQWFSAPSDRAAAVRRALYAPTAVLESVAGTAVLLEGHPDDVAGQARGAGLTPGAAPTRPAGEHRGRINVPGPALGPVLDALRARSGTTWLAEHGVGTVHVATGSAGELAAARELAHAHGGWLLREAGAPELDPFGVALPAAALQGRVRAAFDPDGRCAPGRFPA